MKLYQKKHLLIFTIFLVIVIYAISQTVPKSSIFSLCEKNINKVEKAPIKRLNLKNLTGDKESYTCGNDYHSLRFIDGVGYDWYNSKNSKTWLTQSVYDDVISGKSSEWLEYLVLANPDLKYISHSKKSDYIVIADTINSENGTWVIFVEKNKAKLSESLSEWNLINLTDTKFNFEFAKMISNPTGFNNSQLQKIMKWGYGKFDNLSIKAILPEGYLNISENKKLDVIELKKAFDLNGNERPKTLDNLNLSDPSVVLSYLIEADNKWYAWDGKEAKKNPDYMPDVTKPMVVDKEAQLLRDDPFQAWFRLANYTADYVDYENNAITYIDHIRANIYSIKKNKENKYYLFQPIQLDGDSSKKKEDLSVILGGLTKDNFKGNQLIRKVMYKWINSPEDIHEDDHYYVSSTTKYDLDKDAESIGFQLGTISLNSSREVCLYGWHKDLPGPNLVECNFCPFLKKSNDLMNGIVGMYQKIISIKQVDGIRWRVAVIQRKSNESSLPWDFIVYEIDTSLNDKNTIAKYRPLDFLAGTQINQDSVRACYLASVWEQVKGIGVPSEKKIDCNSWTTKEIKGDKFLVNYFLGENGDKMIGIENPDSKVIRQILPALTYQGEDPNVCLVGMNKNLVIPYNFMHLPKQVGWLYSVEEDKKFKRYLSSSGESDHELPLDDFNYSRSAWLNWLALAKPELKIITNGTDCQKNFQSNCHDSIRVAFLLKSGGSLFSWQGTLEGQVSSSFIPSTQTMIESRDPMLLYDAPNSFYLENLYNYPIPNESLFYCEHLGKNDFDIADVSEPSGKKTTFIKLRENPDFLTCLSGQPHIANNSNRRMIYFINVTNSTEALWGFVKKRYNSYNFRGSFIEEILKDYNTVSDPGSANLKTYWGSLEKFGMERGNEVEVFTMYDGKFGNIPYRFSFINSQRIMGLANSECHYVTRFAQKPGEISNYFYSWINDSYKIGGQSGSIPNFWRANPLGYFDRLK